MPTRHATAKRPRRPKTAAVRSPGDASFVNALLGDADWLRVHPLVEEGLAKEVFRAGTVERFVYAMPEAVRSLVQEAIVPERTWKRRRLERSPLSAAELGRMTSIAQVVREVRRIYGGATAAAERFLISPHPLLRGRAPIVLAAAPGGQEAVLELVHRIEEGAPV